MANRVVLGAFDGTFVLRTSVPGANVLDTGLSPEDVSFDSRWQAASNLLAQGSTAMKYYLGDLLTYWYADLTLPTGLSRAPNVFGMCRHQTSTSLFTSLGGPALSIATNGYNSSTGKMRVYGGFPPWTIDAPYNQEITWGFMTYFVLRG